MKWGVKEILKLDHVEIRNGPLPQGLSVTGVCTDSRVARPGDLFVALTGERFDGRRFVGGAVAHGAVAAVVQQSRELPGVPSVPLIVVKDTVKALGDLARMYRQKFSLPILAIGGSNGKTTTKEMVAAVLATGYRVLWTEGNLNNHIGVPLTIFRLQKEHEIAVVEIGTNHPGEIDYLCRILLPTHGLLTNIGSEHLEFLHDIEGVANEEGALFRWLRPAGLVFVNANDRHVVRNARPNSKKVTYGFNARQAAVRGSSLRLDSAACPGFRFTGNRMRRGMSVQLGVPGRHNAHNALAAAAVGLSFRIPPAKIRDVLQTFSPVGKRMEVLHVHGITVLNDSYNANPESMLAALAALAEMSVAGKRIAVLGDMRELGAGEIAEHQEIGKDATRLGIEYLLTYGELARQIHASASVPFSAHYEQKSMLAEYLVELLAPGDAVLIKGSRAMRMEDIVTFLLQRLEPVATSA